MYPAQGRSIWKPYVAAVGALLAVAVLFPAPALAARTAGNERGEYVDEASVNSRISHNRQSPEMDASDGANPEPLRAAPNRVAALPSRSHESKPDGIIAIRDLLRREIINNSSGDKSDLAGPDIATQPEESPIINARVPGLSDDTLARLKNRMYRKDI